MATVRISGNWRNPGKLDFAGVANLDAAGKIERSLDLPEECYLLLERDIAKGANEGKSYLPNGTYLLWFVDR